MNDKHALWLPENSIRAILALMLTIATIGAVFKQLPMEYVSILSTAGGFAWGLYFGEKIANKNKT